MEALFKSRFPFVDKPDSELNKEEKTIKKTYDKTYNKPIQKKDDQLREVYKDDQRAG